MPIKSKFISASLFACALFLTACGNKTDETDARLAALEESCIKIASLEASADVSQKLCSCVKSKMETSYSEEEHKIVTSVFTDAATMIEDRQDEPSELDLIMLHSDFDKEEAERFVERVGNDVNQCENTNG